jgi:hypothetical protein
MVGHRSPIHDPIMNQRYHAISLPACDLTKEIQTVCNSFTFEFQLHTEFTSIKVLKKNKLYIVMPVIISHIHVSHMLQNTKIIVNIMSNMRCFWLISLSCSAKVTSYTASTITMVLLGMYKNEGSYSEIQQQQSIKHYIYSKVT